jgi:WD40 repeat protein
VPWRIPRFTSLQLFLATALCALVLGLFTAAWRASNYSQVTAVRFSPDGKYLAARYESGDIQVWDVGSRRPRRVAAIASPSPWAGLHFAGNETLVDVPCHSSRGRILATVHTLHLPTGRLRSGFSCQTAADGLLYAAAGNTLLFVDWPTSTAHCYSLRDQKLVRSIPGLKHWWGFSLSADGRNLVIPDGTDAVQVYDLATGRVLHREAAEASVPPAISYDGRRLAFVCWHTPGAVLGVRDLADNGPIRILSPEMAVRWIAFSADGGRLATAGHEGAELFDTQTGRCVGRILFDDTYRASKWTAPATSWRSGGGLGQFSLSADGQTLASFDGTRILLWDFNGGTLRRTIASDSRAMQIVLLVTVFAVWSAAWGIVSRRQREREHPAAPGAAWESTPIEIKLCWGMMVIGGLVALTLSIATLLLAGPVVWPMFYVALGTGMVAVAQGAARETRGLPRVALLQLINVGACDPVNFLLGTLAQILLGRPHVQHFLRLRNHAVPPVLR